MQNTHSSRLLRHPDWVWACEDQAWGHFEPFVATREPTYPAYSVALTQSPSFHRGELIAKLNQIRLLPRDFSLGSLHSRPREFLDGSRNIRGETLPYRASQLLQEAIILDPAIITKP
jgi:hypothetical protein